MQTIQKIIWLRFLMLGFSVLLLIPLQNCGQCDGCDIRLVDVELVYKNETSNKIDFYNYTIDSNFFKFEMEPFGSFTENIQGIRSVSAPFDIDCCGGAITSFQGSGDILLIFDETDCLLFEGDDGPAILRDVIGFEFEKTGDNSVRYTYTFTEEDRTNAEPCE